MEPYPYRLDWQVWQKAARDFVGESQPLVSVDWDFFYQIPSRALFADELAEMMPGRVNIEEWFSSRRSLAHWQDVYERLQAIGFAPRDYFSQVSQEELAAFSQKLTDAFLFDQVYIADSHAWGSWASLVAAGDGQTEIISFDAHHDCGYINYFPGDSEERSQIRAERRPSCDDWIQAALVHDIARGAEVIYPQFAAEEFEIHQPTLPWEQWSKVEPAIFDAWPGRAKKEKATLLLVRSSAYSPPFFARDEHFLDLANLLAPRVTCLDCLAPAGVRIGDHDACRPRL